MRSKKESAVSTRLSEAPTAHSSTAIAAALHGGKAARGALLARWWQRTLQAPRDPCIFSAASPTLCAARWSACMAQLRYHTERQRVSERGTWARSREQTSGSGERTSSHDNALCWKRSGLPLENGTTRAAAGTFSFPAVSGAVLVPAGFAPQPPPYMRGTQLVGQHGCGRTLSSARPPGCTCTGVSYNTKSFRRFDRRIRAAGETNPTCRGSPRLLKS